MYPNFKKVGDELQGNSTATDHTTPINLTPESEPSSKQGEKETIEIPEWILKYDRANYQSGAGKAVRELLNIIKKLQS